jgi:hypothetical protein
MVCPAAAFSSHKFSAFQSHGLFIIFDNPPRSSFSRKINQEEHFVSPFLRQRLVFDKNQSIRKHHTNVQSAATKDIDEDDLGRNYSQRREMSTPEMVSMSTVGIFLIVGVLLTLSLDDSTAVVRSSTESTQFLSIETLEVASSNLVEAAIPTSVSDVVAIACGEAIASIVGAFASFLVSVSLKWNNKMKNSQKFSDAIADGDFLITQAAAFPLLEVIGFSPVLATLSSIGLAMVPSSIIKLDARRQQSSKDEIDRQKQLLEENKKRQEWKLPNLFPNQFYSLSTPLQGNTKNYLKSFENNLQTESKILPVQEQPDLVELFSDVTKWLQYSFLSKEFSGTLSSMDLIITAIPGGESALYGSVATVSSQLYSDVLYGYFGFGSKEKGIMVRERSVEDWGNLYLYRTLYAATLFGVFGFVQAPVRYIVNAFLSGGVDACYGSTEFNACIETYLAINSPGASAEAQLRSLIAAAYSTIYNYGLSEMFPFSVLIESLSM